ncbi:NAD(P)-dependent oxidoreductase [Hoeflea sp. CAU 1731]
MTNNGRDTFRTEPVVLITGATGNLGSKLARELVKNSQKSILVDQMPHPNLNVRIANLSVPGNWMQLFAGVDIVIHLAGTSKVSSSPDTLKSQNVDCTANVLKACRMHNVSRIVFASSLRVMDGYREFGRRITEDLPPKPSGDFGRSKLHCEKLLAAYPDVICLRLGWSPRYNIRENVLRAPKRLREVWLSDSDFLQAIELSISAENRGFTVFNLTSDVENSRYPLSRARKHLGYKPRDGVNKTQIVISKLSGTLFSKAAWSR